MATISTRNAMIMLGNVYQLIASHNWGFWLKYVDGVNMSYIECPTIKDRDNGFPKFENRFYLDTAIEEVKCFLYSRLSLVSIKIVHLAATAITVPFNVI